ncbi:LytR/AlgR family response regulator transcription factor [Aquimarina megaterium]|uniref:LytR/AlgR family response regulator transcription factor n=1 Tax=Aquimarina megaterium TaxID=1443666 RepID=UPI000472D547|nr:LytTR family DNA-binding domain-containing protein [Aquimarina megaterium]
MKLNVIIIDDEQLARKLLESYISKIEHLNLLGSFKSPISALTILKEKKVDVILLDIRMPDISGLDFLKTLENTPKVILTTAYREYALEGYEYNVIDYLLKPIEFSRFIRAINKVSNNKGENTIAETEKQGEYINLKYNKKTFRILKENILFIKAESEYVNYHLKNGQKLLIYGTLKEVETRLSSPNFCRIHRSYVINPKHIDYVEGNRIIIHDQKLPISESYKKAFLKIWNT